MAINKRPRWRGPNRLWDRRAASFLEGGKWSFGVVWWGLDRGAFRHRAMEYNRSAQSRTLPTSQSTSDRVGAVGIDCGIAGRLHLEKGENGVFGRLVGVESGGISQ
jgi:hypothetical protein